MVFFDAIAAQGRALSRTSLDQADTSLTPPQALLTHAQDLRAILALHTAESEAESIADGDGDGEMGSAEDNATIERALDALVDPAVRMCVAAAGEKDAALRRQAVPALVWDRPVFVLNCLTYLVDTLAPYPCAARKRTELDSAVEARVLELIEEHVRDFFLLAPSHIFSNFFHLSMRRSCVIQVCTTPSAHVNRLQTTYVTSTSTPTPHFLQFSGPVPCAEIFKH